MPIPNPDPDFLQLVEAHQGIIYKICHSYCRHAADRDDLAQEILYQLWRSAHRYDRSQRFTTWMYRVALNTAISFYRKTPGPTLALSIHEENIADTDAPEDENLKRLQTFIQGLKDFEKALIILYLEGQSHKEIAAIMGITPTHVGTSIGRIKEKLKQKFSTIKE